MVSQIQKIPSKVSYVVDEPLATSSVTDQTTTYTLPSPGLYLILARANADTTTNAPYISISDASSNNVQAQGTNGGNVFAYKLVAIPSSPFVVTVRVKNCTGGGMYSQYNRITILRLSDYN